MSVIQPFLNNSHATALKAVDKVAETFTSAVETAVTVPIKHSPINRPYRLLQERAVAIYDSMPGILKFLSPPKNSGKATRNNLAELKHYILHHPEVETNPTLKELKRQLFVDKKISPEFSQLETDFWKALNDFQNDKVVYIGKIKDEGLRARLFKMFIESSGDYELQKALHQMPPSELRNLHATRFANQNLDKVLGENDFYGFSLNGSLDSLFENYDLITCEKTKKELAQRVFSEIERFSLREDITSNTADKILLIGHDDFFRLSKIVPFLDDEASQLKTINIVMSKYTSDNREDLTSLTKAILSLKDEAKSIELLDKFVAKTGEGDSPINEEAVEIIKEPALDIFANAIAESNNENFKSSFAKRIIDDIVAEKATPSIPFSESFEKLFLSIKNKNVQKELLEKTLSSSKEIFPDVIARRISELEDSSYKDKLILKLYNSELPVQKKFGIRTLHSLSDGVEKTRLIDEALNDSSSRRELTTCLGEVKDQALFEKLVSSIISKSPSICLELGDIANQIHRFSDDAPKIEFLLKNIADLWNDEAVGKILESIQSDELRVNTARAGLELLKDSENYQAKYNIIQSLKYINDDSVILHYLEKFKDHHYSTSYKEAVNAIQDKKLKEKFAVTDYFGEKKITNSEAVKVLENNPLTNFFFNTFENALKNTKTGLSEGDAYLAYTKHTINGHNSANFGKLLSDYEEFIKFASRKSEVFLPQEVNAGINMLRNSESLTAFYKNLGVLDIQELKEKDLRTVAHALVQELKGSPFPKDLAKKSKEEILCVFNKKFTPEEKLNLENCFIEAANEYARRNLATSSQTILSAISMVGQGNVKDIATLKAVKFTTFLQNIEKIGKDKELTTAVTQACSSNKLGSVLSDRLVKLAVGFEKFGKKEQFIELVNEMNKAKKLDFKKLARDFFVEIAKESGISEEEIAKITDKQLMLWDFDQIPTMATAIKKLDEEPKKWLMDLVGTTINGRYWKYIFDPNTKVGQANIATKRLFDKEGLNFTQWLKYSGTKTFSMSTGFQEQLSAVIYNIGADIKELASDSSIRSGLLEHIKSLGFEYADGVIKIADGTPITREVAEGFLVNVDKLMQKFYQQRVANKADSIFTIKNHLAERIRDLKRLTNSSKTEELTIQLWKRQPGHDLFQGSYCQCCIALDGINNKSIVESLVHTVDQIAEIKTKDGQTIGKVKLFWAKDLETQKQILVANGFEVSSGYQQKIDIRNASLEFIKDYAKAVTGKTDTPIYMGKSYNDVPIIGLQSEKLNVQLIGKVTNDEYYFDSLSAGTWSRKLDKPKEAELLVLR